MKVYTKPRHESVISIIKNFYFNLGLEQFKNQQHSIPLENRKIWVGKSWD